MAQCRCSVVEVCLVQVAQEHLFFFYYCKVVWGW
jgi:hypothetical protein